jgi:shikimate dehydrogenase
MRRLAVLGYPVSHSRSPAMQSAALAELGLGERWSYEAIEVMPERFAALVAALPGDGFAGVNVTVPHKLAALAIADRASDAARAIGAANTLCFTDDGVAAENTDAVGISAAIGKPLDRRRALVLGAGGSARAAVWALREAGAEASIWNRTANRGEALARELGVGRAVEPFAGDFDLILNATTLGLRQANERSPVPEDLKALPFDADAINERQVVVDLVYGSHETALASCARKRGARVIDGLEVLVHQGAASLRIWTGLDPPIETMRRAARGE